MPINQYIKPAEFTPLDPTFLLRAKAYNEEKADKANDAFDALYADISKIKAVPADIPKRNEIVKGYNDQLKSWVDTYGNNPVQGINDLRRIKRDFNQNFYYGQLGDIHNKGLQFENVTKEFADADKEGKFQGMSDIAYHNMVTRPMQEYEAAGGSQEKAPGIYNSIGFGRPTKYEDLGKDMIDLVNGWKANKAPIPIGPNGSLLYQEGKGFILSETKEVVPEDEVYNYALQYMYANPKYATQLQHMNNYYQTQADAVTKVADAGDGTGIPYMESVDNQGNPIYMKPFTGADITKEHVSNLAKVAAAKEGYTQITPTHLDDFYARELFKKSLDEKQDYGTVGIPAPSVVSPSNDYYNQKVQGLQPYGVLSKTATALSTAFTSPPGLAGPAIVTGLMVPSEKRTFTENEKADLKKAANLMGRTVPDVDSGYETQINEGLGMLENYYKFLGNKHVNINLQVPRNKYGQIDPVKLKEQGSAYNQALFGNPEGGTGTSIGGNTIWKVIGGSSQKEISGNDLLKQVGDKSKMRWVGSLPIDNPYYPRGQVFAATEENGANKGMYVLQDSDAGYYTIPWLMYQSKLGEDIDLSNYRSGMQVRYKYGVDPLNVTKEGAPIASPDKDSAYLLDRFGNVITVTIPNLGTIELKSDPGSPDPIGNLYTKLQTAEKAGALKDEY